MTNTTTYTDNDIHRALSYGKTQNSVLKVCDLLSNLNVHGKSCFMSPKHLLKKLNIKALKTLEWALYKAKKLGIIDYKMRAGKYCITLLSMQAIYQGFRSFFDDIFTFARFRFQKDFSEDSEKIQGDFSEENGCSPCETGDSVVQPDVEAVDIKHHAEPEAHHSSQTKSHPNDYELSGTAGAPTSIEETSVDEKINNIIENDYLDDVLKAVGLHPKQDEYEYTQIKKWLRHRETPQKPRISIREAEHQLELTRQICDISNPLAYLVDLAISQAKYELYNPVKGRAVRQAGQAKANNPLNRPRTPEELDILEQLRKNNSVSITHEKPPF